MKNMTNVLDSLVRELKTHTELCDVRFVHAGKVSAAENPLSAFVAACEVKSFFADKEAGSVRGKLLLTLCAPKGRGKRELCELMVVFASLIEESDLKDNINSIYSMEATYDAAATLWRQGVAVEVEFATEKKTEGVEAEIRGVGSILIEKAEEISRPGLYEIRELLSGVAGFEKNEGVNTLQLVLCKDCVLPEKAFDLKIPALGSVYKGCRLQKAERNLLSKRTELMLCFEGKTVLEEGV